MINFDLIKENLKLEKRIIIIYIHHQLNVEWESRSQEFVSYCHNLSEFEILNKTNDAVLDFYNKIEDMYNVFFISYDKYFDNSEILKIYKGHKSLEVKRALIEINKIYGGE